MVSSKSLVLITGATGHVGSSTLVHLLRAGYRVRAAVRSQSKAEAILSRPRIAALATMTNLSFVIVPDITMPGAYDDAMEGVTHVIHIASPLATGSSCPIKDHDTHFIQPAVRGTIGMLEAANMCGTVRRVVITSSISAIAPTAELEGTKPVSRHMRPVSPDDRLPFVEGPYESEFQAYAASKIAALHHAEAWMEREGPAFDAVHLHPAFVIGRNDVATSPAEAMKGTNGVILAMLMGKSLAPFAGATVHVEDVARAHVAALDPTILGNQSYILSSPARWNDAKTIARRAFPEAARAKIIGRAGNVNSIPIPIDSSLTEAEFGFRFTGFDEQVISTVGQFLELKYRKKAFPARSIASSGQNPEITPHVSILA
jgi:nucleoside-diphosphate-sugar epimerase